MVITTFYVEKSSKKSYDVTSHIRLLYKHAKINIIDKL